MNRQSTALGRCRLAAMNFLARRSHSVAELKGKLRRRFSAEIVDEVVEKLQGEGFLNDATHAKDQAQMRARRRFTAPEKIAEDLMRNGVEEAAARAAVEGMDALGLAKELAGKHLARLRRLPPTVAKRRLAGMLARRGFDEGIVETVVGENNFLATDEPDQI